MLTLALWSVLCASTPAAFAGYFDPSLADGFALHRGAAPAHGRVLKVSESAVLLEHSLLENEQVVRTRSLLSPVRGVLVKQGDLVKRGAPVARESTSAEILIDARLELTSRATPALRKSTTDFVRRNASLVVPALEPLAVLIDQRSHRMRLYREGEFIEEVEVGFGQSSGAKERRGDNRTPRGAYFIVQKHRGEFGGPYGGYFGGHWLRLNYPNRWDAERGVAEGWIARGEAERISRLWLARRPTNEKTRLGGGIGFHGWAHEWSLSETSGRMSWGCIVMHNDDIKRLFDSLEEGALVILF